MIKYYLIGEIHGTNECPVACLDLLQRHGLTRLAVEFDKEYQHEFDEFFERKRAIDDLTVFQERQRSQDGRTSQAMRQLLLTAQEQGVRLHCVDNFSNPTLREESMARNIQLIPGPVAYFCGNVHASKKRIVLEETSLFYQQYNGLIQPCGSLLPLSETLSYKIVSVSGGMFYNLELGKIEGHKELTQRYQNFPVIIPSPEEGYDFWYLVRQFTPST